MNLLRHKASIVDWNSFVDDNIDIYAEYINSTILSVANKCNGNTRITVHPSDLAWITSELKINHMQK